MWIPLNCDEGAALAVAGREGCTAEAAIPPREKSGPMVFIWVFQ